MKIRDIRYFQRFLNKLPISTILLIVFISLVIQSSFTSIPTKNLESKEVNDGIGYDFFKSEYVEIGQTLEINFMLVNTSILFHFGIVPPRSAEKIEIDKKISSNLTIMIKAGLSGKISSYGFSEGDGLITIVLEKSGIATGRFQFMTQLGIIVLIFIFLEYFNYRRRSLAVDPSIKIHDKTNQFWLIVNMKRCQISLIPYLIFILVYNSFNNLEYSTSPPEVSGKSAYEHNLYQFSENYSRVAMIFLVIALPISKYQDFWYHGKKEMMHSITYPTNRKIEKISDFFILVFYGVCPAFILNWFNYYQ